MANPPAPAQAQGQDRQRLPILQVSPYLEHPGEPVVPIKQWLVRFDLYIESVEMNLPQGQQMNDREKNFYLYGNLGAEGIRVFSLNPAAANRGAQTYDQYKRAVQGHFAPRISKFKARYDFNKRVQESDETVDEFLTGLRSMAADCEFQNEADVNDHLLLQLITGCADKKTQEVLLATPDINLEGALQTMRARETAQQESAKLSKPPQGINEAVHAIGKGPQQPNRSAQMQSKDKCYSCGETHPRGKCPAHGKECNKCHKLNHFAKVCRSTNVPPRQNKDFRPQNAARQQPVRLKQLLAVEEDPSNELYKADVLIGSGSRFKRYRIELDCGAAPSTLRISDYERLFSHRPFKEDRTLFLNYDKTEAKGFLGMIEATVKFGSKQHTDKFRVVEDSLPSVLGRNFLNPLGIIRVAAPDETQPALNQIDCSNPVAAFPRLTSEELGTFPGYKHVIRVQSDIVPRAVRLRPIPLARREAAEKEVQKMDEQGVWEETTASEWAHPLVTVPKPDGGVRITTDLTGLNKYVIPQRHPLPKIKDLFLELKGARFFSKLDLKKGYYHIVLDEQSRELTTTITPLGLRRYCRLPMGLTDAASVFQRLVQQILAGCEGVINYMDDIIPFGKTEEDHDKNLLEVLRRLDAHDLRLQTSKCLFRQKSVPAFGHIISATGITPDPRNLQSIQDAPVPTNVTDVQSFLGVVNFYSSFLSDVASLAEPLRRLTRKGETFSWTAECDLSFQTLKKSLVENLRVFVFDPEAQTFVTTDASDVGIGGVLSQMQNGKEVPIAFFSKTLSPTERNYATNEKEAYACLLACEHWEKLLLGRHFILKTDHAPLTTILKQPHGKRESAKFARWLERMEQFDFATEYLQGSSNRVADYLSRLKQRAEDLNIPVPQALKGIRYASFRSASLDDTVFLQLRELLQKKKWPRDAENAPELKPFCLVRAELSFQDGCLFRGKRMVPPLAQRWLILAEAHKGHPGITRFKRLLRNSYWWPGMDAKAEDYVRHCVACQRSAKSQPKHKFPAVDIPAPDKPRAQYAIDITGPFYNGRSLVVLIDYYSHFPYYLDTKNTTSATIIAWLADIFSQNGNPEGLVSDNGPQFTSAEFEHFLKERDIHHYLIPVYAAQENGLVESFNRYLKYGTQTFDADGIRWKDGLRELVGSYRVTPLKDHGKSPAELHFNSPVRPSHEPNRARPTRRVFKPRRGRVETETGEAQIKERFFPGSIYKKGNMVLVRLPHVPKGRSPYSAPLKVEKVLGNRTFLLSDGQVWNSRNLKPFRTKPVETFYLPESNTPGADASTPRRSGRATQGRPPPRYKEYFCRTKLFAKRGMMV